MLFLAQQTTVTSMNRSCCCARGGEQSTRSMDVTAYRKHRNGPKRVVSVGKVTTRKRSHSTMQSYHGERGPGFDLRQGPTTVTSMNRSCCCARGGEQSTRSMDVTAYRKHRNGPKRVVSVGKVTTRKRSHSTMQSYHGERGPGFDLRQGPVRSDHTGRVITPLFMACGHL
uniref:Uncharacterized protein n=1 Tax=Hyaloperonospora arabidopsidis (strain Emoy2) TaxID=559515 RepID=M4BUX5_HYAAE